MLNKQLISSIIIIPTIILLSLLGNWQVNRLEYKNKLQRQIDIYFSLPPILNQDFNGGVDLNEYRKISLVGKFIKKANFHLVNQVYKGEVGINIISVFKPHKINKYILVNRGWFPNSKKHMEYSKHPFHNDIIQNITIDGIIRAIKQKNFLVPDNEPDKNLWFHIDPLKMSKEINLLVNQKYYIKINDKPKLLGQTSNFTRNKVHYKHHLFFSITWYSLSFILLLMYIHNFWRKKRNDK